MTFGTSDKELAAIIARGIFKAFDLSPEVKCWRIQGMSRRSDNSERALGGFGEEPLADHIEKILAEHRSY